jgi:hypothetical protein
MITDRDKLKYSDPSLNVGVGAGSDRGVSGKTTFPKFFWEKQFCEFGCL